MGVVELHGYRRGQEPSNRLLKEYTYISVSNI